MKAYPAYAPSGEECLGEVPKHWPRAAVRAITRPVSEKGRSDLPLLSVYRDYGVVQRTEEDENRNTIPEDLTNYKVVRPGTLVLNKMKTWQGSLGVSEFEGIVSPAYITCALRGGHNPRFIHHLLRCQPYVFAWRRISYGVRCDQWDMRYADFKQTPVFVPPRHEQDAIVAFLEAKDQDIQTFIANKRRTIELLKEQKTALINRAVTRGLNPKAPLKPSGIPWLGDIPEHWVVAPVSARYEVQLGKMLDASRITGRHLAPYLRNVDVQWGRINVENLPEMDFSPADRMKFSLRRGDLLVCEGGEVGRAAIWNGELDTCFYQKALHRLRPRSNRDKPIFMLYMLFNASSQGVFAAQGGLTTIDHLPAETLRRYRFAFPPVEEQIAIVSLIEDESIGIGRATATAEREIALMEEYRTALIAAAVTGRIDVRSTSHRP